MQIETDRVAGLDEIPSELRKIFEPTGVIAHQLGESIDEALTNTSSYFGEHDSSDMGRKMQ